MKFNKNSSACNDVSTVIGIKIAMVKPVKKLQKAHAKKVTKFWPQFYKLKTTCTLYNVHISFSLNVPKPFFQIFNCLSTSNTALFAPVLIL
jgi:hypothetical protein